MGGGADGASGAGNLYVFNVLDVWQLDQPRKPHSLFKSIVYGVSEELASDFVAEAEGRGHVASDWVVNPLCTAAVRVPAVRLSMVLSQQWESLALCKLSKRRCVSRGAAARFFLLFFVGLPVTLTLSRIGAGGAPRHHRR